MNEELNNNERIKKNMNIAWEWMNALGFQAYCVSVYDFGVTLQIEESRLEPLHKMLEAANEKEVIFDISHDSDTGFTYYTFKDIGLKIVFTN